MSTIKVISTIEKLLDGSFGNGAVVKNNFASKKSGEANEFVSDYCLVDSWVLNSTQAATFDQDILSVLDNTVGNAQVTFMHVQCYKKENLPGDQPDPIRFGLFFDGASVGRMSQLQMANIEEFPYKEVAVRNPDVTGTNECILTVVIGFNKA